MPIAKVSAINASDIDCLITIEDRLQTVDVRLISKGLSLSVSMTRAEAQKLIDGLIKAMHDAGPVHGRTL